MPILYNARRHHSEAEERFNALYCELDTLLREADFVCLILPLTDETRHLIGKAAFEKMKKSAIFINAGRGPVVDEKALNEALQNGEIHAAGLDVFEQEPLPVDSPLLTMPNVVALPHIGSATHETRYNMAATAVDNLIAALGGKVDKNCVNHADTTVETKKPARRRVFEFSATGLEAYRLTTLPAAGPLAPLSMVKETF